MDLVQFKRVVDLAGSYHDESVRCAEAKAFYAACLMIGCALEAALLATAVLCEKDLRELGCWPKVKPPPERWTLSQLTALARQAGWLPALGSGEPRDLNEAEVGDAVEFVRWLRDLAAHPGRHIREGRATYLGEVAYRNAYGVLAAVFDETYKVMQSLD
jgi:hypothetical protein